MNILYHSNFSKLKKETELSSEKAITQFWNKEPSFSFGICTNCTTGLVYSLYLYNCLPVLINKIYLY